jgi:hypothetical protein
MGLDKQIGPLLASIIRDPLALGRKPKASVPRALVGPVALRSSIHAAVVTIRPHRNDALSAATSIQSLSLVLVFDDTRYKIAVDRTLSQSGLSDRGYA